MDFVIVVRLEGTPGKALDEGQIAHICALALWLGNRFIMGRQVQIVHCAEERSRQTANLMRAALGSRSSATLKDDPYLVCTETPRISTTKGAVASWCQHDRPEVLIVLVEEWHLPDVFDAIVERLFDRARYDPQWRLTAAGNAEVVNIARRRIERIDSRNLEF